MYSGKDRSSTSTRCPSQAPTRPLTRGTISAWPTKASPPARISDSCATTSVAPSPGRIDPVARSQSQGHSPAGSPARKGAGMMSWLRNRHSAPCPIGGDETCVSTPTASASQASASRGRIHCRTVAISRI